MQEALATGMQKYIAEWDHIVIILALLTGSCPVLIVDGLSRGTGQNMTISLRTKYITRVLSTVLKYQGDPIPRDPALEAITCDRLEPVLIGQL